MNEATTDSKPKRRWYQYAAVALVAVLLVAADKPEKKEKGEEKTIAEEQPAILQADMKSAAKRIKESIGDQWKVKVRGKEIVIERTKPVAFASLRPSDFVSNRGDSGAKAHKASRPTQLKACRYTLRFSDKVTIKQYEQFRAENRAMDKKLNALQAKMQHIPVNGSTTICRQMMRRKSKWPNIAVRKPS